MTEDEKEAMVYRLWDEFAASIGLAANDEKKFAFVAGARAALYEMGRRNEIGRPTIPTLNDPPKG